MSASGQATKSPPQTFSTQPYGGPGTVCATTAGLSEGIRSTQLPSPAERRAGVTPPHMTVRTHAMNGPTQPPFRPCEALSRLPAGSRGRSVSLQDNGPMSPPTSNPHRLAQYSQRHDSGRFEGVLPFSEGMVGVTGEFTCSTPTTQRDRNGAPSTQAEIADANRPILNKTRKRSR